MTFSAFSQPWPSEPPAFAWPDEPRQFSAYEDFYEEYEPTEHDDEGEDPLDDFGDDDNDLMAPIDDDAIHELAQHLGVSPEEVMHLAQIFNDAGGHKPVEQEFNDPASLEAPGDVPHHIADWHNKGWVRRKPGAMQPPLE